MAERSETNKQVEGYEPKLGDVVICGRDRGWMGIEKLRCEVVAGSGAQLVIVNHSYGIYFEASDVVEIESRA